MNMDVLHAAALLRRNLRRVFMDFFMTCSEGDGLIWNIHIEKPRADPPAC